MAAWPASSTAAEPPDHSYRSRVAVSEDAEAAVPLLQASDSAMLDVQRRAARASFWRALFAMCKVMIGAGMMAIPRAYYLLGSLLGTFMLLFVAYLTYWTKSVLVEGSAVTGCSTYALLARATCGRGAALAVQLAVWAFCFGFMVIYLVVIGDILAGSAGQCNGLLCELLGLQPDRRHVIAAFALLICAPALANKSVEALSLFNALGVMAVAVLGAAVAGLAVVAVGQGMGHSLPLWPQWGAFGEGRFEVVMGVASVVPVVLSCYVGHQNLHSIMPMAKPYTPARMKAIVGCALAVAAAIFLMLAVGGGIAFGAALEVNLLSNMYTEGMSPIVGQRPAQALNLAVRGGYLVCLLGSFLLFMFPLRTTLAEVLARDGSIGRSSRGGRDGSCGSAGPSGFDGSSRDAMDGRDGSSNGTNGFTDSGRRISTDGGEDNRAGISLPAQQARAAEAAAAAEAANAGSAADTLVERHFYALTYGLLLLIVAAAALVPNIWSALSLVGDVASTVEGFIVPALIALALTGWRSSRRDASLQGALQGGSWGRICLAQFVLLLGVALFVNGILQHTVFAKS